MDVEQELVRAFRGVPPATVASLVREYFRHVRPLPVGRGVAAELRVHFEDAAGGVFVPMLIRRKDEAGPPPTSCTYAALVAIRDGYGAWTVRGMTGANFSAAVTKALLDLAHEKDDVAKTQRAALAVFEADGGSQAPKARTGEAKRLEAWAEGMLSAWGDNIFESPSSGKVGAFGFERRSFCPGSWFLAVARPAATPAATRRLASGMTPQAAAMLSHLDNATSPPLFDASGVATSAYVPPSEAALGGRAASPAGSQGSRGSKGSKGSVESAVSQLAQSLVAAGVPARAARRLARGGVVPEGLATMTMTEASTAQPTRASDVGRAASSRTTSSSAVGSRGWWRAASGALMRVISRGTRSRGWRRALTLA